MNKMAQNIQKCNRKLAEGVQFETIWQT